jgi:hypothetical protein
VKSPGNPTTSPIRKLTGGRPEIRIVLAYLLFGSLWIFLSDKALTLLTNNPDQLALWQTYKGSGFILITALLLFSMLRRAFSGTRHIERSLRESEARLRRFFD